MAFDLRPPYAQAADIKVSYNLGGCLDIPTGKFLKGRHGEYILNGGLAASTGICGISNNFKSTLMLAMMLIPMSRIHDCYGNIYDTEYHVVKSRISELAYAIPGFGGQDIMHDGRVTVTSKTEYHGNEWYEMFKTYNKDKIAASKQLMRHTPFMDWKSKKRIKILVPTPHGVDSFTEFETEDVAAMQANNELGDSGANTIYMRQGQSKTRFLQDVGKVIHRGNSPLLLSAHIGKIIPMDARAAPIKKMQYLKNGDTMKGVTDRFLFLTTNCWQAQNAAPLMNDTTKAAEYPRDSDDSVKGSNDLIMVTLSCLRSKNGPSGFALQLLLSQKEGFLPTLTEFHYLKTNNRFGFEGNDRNYSIVLCPDIALSRTTVRGKIDANPDLRRAFNILSELSQMTLMQRVEHEAYLLTPKELYEGVKAKGLDWDFLLKNTRGYWTFDNDMPYVEGTGNPLYFLSTKDLLNIAKGTYWPFWLDPKDPKRILSDEEISELFVDTPLEDS